MYNLHRSPYFWDNPEEFEPERFLQEKSGSNIEGWAGFDPKRGQSSLYANEVLMLSIYDMAWLVHLPLFGGWMSFYPVYSVRFLLKSPFCASQEALAGRGLLIQIAFEEAPPSKRS